MSLWPKSVLASSCGTLLFICTFAVASHPGKRHDDTYSKMDLPHHSFTSPLQYSALLSDWTLSGATIFERERLLMHPGISTRQGFAWNKQPLLTNNFEVTFHFLMSGEKEASKVPSDQSFAFWFVRENISAVFNETYAIKASSWEEGLKTEGFTLSGSKGSYDGFGAVFTVIDGDKRPNPSVSFLSNDAHQALSFGIDVPTREAKIVPFRNTLDAAEMNIRVKPTLVEGRLKRTKDAGWLDCFSVDRKNYPVKAGGFIGFTAWSGTASSDRVSDLLSIVKVEVQNYDDTQLGEEIMDTSEEGKKEYASLMTEEARHLESEKAQAQRIGMLTSMLSSHMKENQPLGDTLVNNIASMGDALHKLDGQCRTLTRELHVLWHPSNKSNSRNTDHVQEMKNEILGLRRLLTKESDAQMNKIEAVQKHVELLKRDSGQGQAAAALGTISSQSATLEQTVKSRGTQMTGMMLGLLGSIALIGYLIWNRMSYYEKKHFI